MANTVQRVNQYVADWRKRGYAKDIPDEVPGVLMNKNLAPSYKAIALAILNNDMHMEALGFSAPQSPWYSAIKRVEIEEREKNNMNKKTLKSDKSEIIARIQQYRSGGKTWEQVAGILNSEGIKTPYGKKFSGSMLGQYVKRGSQNSKRSKVTVAPGMVESKPHTDAHAILQARNTILERLLLDSIRKLVDKEAELLIRDVGN